MTEVYYRAYMEPTMELMVGNSEDYIIHFHEFEVLSHTSCGVWIKYWTAKGKKFINNNNRKRFAYPTKEEAREALGFRLRSYRSHLLAKLEGVEAELKSYKRL